jgi:hypothetical protein
MERALLPACANKWKVLLVEYLMSFRINSLNCVVPLRLSRPCVTFLPFVAAREPVNTFSQSILLIGFSSYVDRLHLVTSMNGRDN